MRWMAALIWRLPPRSRRWRSVLPELIGTGARPAARASLASVAKRVGAGDLADELGGGQRAAARLGDQLRCNRGHERGDLCFERVDRGGQLAQPTQLVACDPDAHRLLAAGQAPGDLGAPLLREQRSARQRELGPEIVEVPLQRAVERHADADEALAVIDQQPQVEFRAGQRGGR